MASTTNFGWSTPDNTGYVKDGALSIRTLGTAIDASMAPLRGGTTDQVLKKASGSNMDFVWGTVSSTPRIAQVVKAGTTSATTAGTSYTDVSGLSVTITPTLSTSKILIATSFGVTASNGGANLYFFGVAQLLRGSTSLEALPSGGYYPTGGGVHTAMYGSLSFNYLDSPATTSATTYKIQIANFFGSPCVVSAGSTFGGEVQIVAMEVLV